MTEHNIAITENPAIHETRDGSTIMVELAPEGFAGWVVERRNPSGEAGGNEMTEHITTITEKPTIHETRDGSTVSHAVAVDGEVLGWVVEHRNASGKTIGWGVWGDQGPDGLFPGRDEAANWLIDTEIEFY